MTNTTGLRALAVIGVLFAIVASLGLFLPDKPPEHPARMPKFHRLPDRLGDPGMGPVNRDLVIEELATTGQVESIVRDEFQAFVRQYPKMASVRVYAYSSDSLATAGWGEWLAMMVKDNVTAPTPEYSVDQTRIADWP